MHQLRWALPALLVVVAGCSREVRLQPEAPVQVDFSGHWELNYQLSEQMQENMEILYLMARSAVERSDGYTDLRWLLPSMEVVELAESVSRTTALAIDQSETAIEIGRGEDFPLTCEFAASGVPLADELGTERCGWDGHQLVFAFRLPDGLRVRHRLTLAPDGEKLNVATTVQTGRSRGGFTINRVYTRYEPLPEEFECRLMVTGTKSCRRARSEGPGHSSP